MQGSTVVEDLVGALRLVGHLSEEDVDHATEAIMNRMQEQEGMVA